MGIGKRPFEDFEERGAEVGKQQMEELKERTQEDYVTRTSLDSLSRLHATRKGPRDVDSWPKRSKKPTRT